MFSKNLNNVLNIDLDRELKTESEAISLFKQVLRISVKSNNKLKKFEENLIEERVTALNQIIVDSFKENMTVATMFQKLIVQTTLLCKNADFTDWGLVAGRIKTIGHWVKIKPYQNHISEHIENMREIGVYGKDILNRISNYSKADLDELNAELNPNLDLTHNIGSVISGMDKYLRPFKHPVEGLQHLYLVNAMIIANEEKNPKKRLKLAKKIYKATALRKLSLATPWLANLRGDGNISSCFILEMEDSLDSITDAWRDIAHISKNGGGVGLYMGNMRAKKAVVNGVKDAAKGINAWVSIVNAIASTVDQNGIRKGAVTVAVPIWHRDVSDFLEIQTEVGDLRGKSFDVFPQVTAPDLFFKHCEEQKGWLTFCPKEIRELTGIDVAHSYGEEFEKAYWLAVEAYEQGKLVNYHYYKNARELIKHLMATIFETGMPYIANIDTINRANPNSHAGFIPCVNLCTESFSVVKAGKWTHCCNLASLVMTNIDSPEELIETTKLAVRCLDYGIKLTNPPTDTAMQHNVDFRTIGIGITGLHDFLARENVHFSDTRALATIAKVVQYHAIKESIELAKEYKPFEMFKGSKWDTGEQIQSLVDANNALNLELKESKFVDRWFGDFNVSSTDFATLQTDINTYGMRNSQVTSPAPNTGTSVFTESSASILPIYDPFFVESGASGTKVQYGAFVKENPLHYSRSFATFSANQITDYVSWMQRFFDTGISMEMIFDRNDPNFSAKTLYDSIIYAWKKGIKAIYYIRTIKEGSTFGALVNSKATSVCVSCAN